MRDTKSGRGSRIWYHKCHKRHTLGILVAMKIWGYDILGVHVSMEVTNVWCSLTKWLNWSTKIIRHIFVQDIFHARKQQIHKENNPTLNMVFCCVQNYVTVWQKFSTECPHGLLIICKITRISYYLNQYLPNHEGNSTAYQLQFSYRPKCVTL